MPSKLIFQRSVEGVSVKNQNDFHIRRVENIQRIGNLRASLSSIVSSRSSSVSRDAEQNESDDAEMILVDSKKKAASSSNEIKKNGFACENRRKGDQNPTHGVCNRSCQLRLDEARKALNRLIAERNALAACSRQQEQQLHSLLFGAGAGAPYSDESSAATPNILMDVVNSARHLVEVLWGVIPQSSKSCEECVVPWNANSESDLKHLLNSLELLIPRVPYLVSKEKADEMVVTSQRNAQEVVKELLADKARGGDHVLFLAEQLELLHQSRQDEEVRWNDERKEWKDRENEMQELVSSMQDKLEEAHRKCETSFAEIEKLNLELEQKGGCWIEERNSLQEVIAQKENEVLDLKKSISMGLTGTLNSIALQSDGKCHNLDRNTSSFLVNTIPENGPEDEKVSNEVNSMHKEILEHIRSSTTTLSTVFEVEILEELGDVIFPIERSTLYFQDLLRESVTMENVARCSAERLQSLRIELETLKSVTGTEAVSQKGKGSEDSLSSIINQTPSWKEIDDDFVFPAFSSKITFFLNDKAFNDFLSIETSSTALDSEVWASITHTPGVFYHVGGAILSSLNVLNPSLQRQWCRLLLSMQRCLEAIAGIEAATKAGNVSLLCYRLLRGLEVKDNDALLLPLAILFAPFSYLRNQEKNETDCWHIIYKIIEDCEEANIDDEEEPIFPALDVNRSRLLESLRFVTGCSLHASKVIPSALLVCLGRSKSVESEIAWIPDALQDTTTMSRELLLFYTISMVGRTFTYDVPTGLSSTSYSVPTIVAEKALQSLDNIIIPAVTFALFETHFSTNISSFLFLVLKSRALLYNNWIGQVEREDGNNEDEYAKPADCITLRKFLLSQHCIEKFFRLLLSDECKASVPPLAENSIDAAKELPLVISELLGAYEENKTYRAYIEELLSAIQG